MALRTAAREMPSRWPAVPPKPDPAPVVDKPVQRPKTQLAQVAKSPPPKDDAIPAPTEDKSAPAKDPAITEPDPSLFDPSLIDESQPTAFNDTTPVSDNSATATSTVKKPDQRTVDHRTWWQKLLDDVVASPALIAALAAAAVVAAGAGAAKFLFPRATCSIDGGSVSLGAPAPKSRWPSLTVDTVLGDPLFSIARSLPMGRRTDAPEPSPA